MTSWRAPKDSEATNGLRRFSQVPNRLHNSIVEPANATTIVQLNQMRPGGDEKSDGERSGIRRASPQQWTKARDAQVMR